jgi:hypothetical protein|tara:strand:+ start:4749 stop:5444 length:696 start_codon:yes stop_codon:yes gene_type:complete
VIKIKKLLILRNNLFLPIFVILYMNGTTSISALPNDATQNKVVLNVTEDPLKSSPQGPPPMALQNNNLLPAATAPSPAQVPMQQMSADNAHAITNALSNTMPTGMPNRDIQMDTQQQQDPYMNPNYIPETEMNDYIENDDTLYNMMHQGKSDEREQDRLDQIYEELQIPLMVMVLYFLFQMPFVKKHMQRLLPSLFTKDENPTFGGYLFKTALFGGTFYGIIKATKYLSEM